MSGRTAIVTGGQLLSYDLGPSHPLRPERVKVTLALIESLGLMTLLELLQPRLAASQELLLFHTKQYLNKVRKYSGRGYGLLDSGDTPAFKGCFEATSWVVGASLAAVESIMSGGASHAFNFSGGLHHAHPDRASGFCIFNDAAVCIAFLKKKYGLKKIAYIDLDAHHGDGVMYGFYDDPSVLDIDLHEDGRYLFPGTGYPDETGKGMAEGLKINLPLPPDTNDNLYIEAFRRTVPPAIKFYEPEFILLQSGADSHINDPLSHLSITVKTYNEAATTIHDLAHQFCQGRVLVLGGGGYKLSNAARCWTSVLSSFVGVRLPKAPPEEWRNYYRTITGEEAPTTIAEPEKEIADQMKRQEIIGVLEELEKSTCIRN